jgi:hypothetical protein
MPRTPESPKPKKTNTPKVPPPQPKSTPAPVASPNALPGGYSVLLEDLKRRIGEARQRASLAVNKELVLLYWSIGKQILARQQTEGWGALVIDTLAVDLKKDFPEMGGLTSKSKIYENFRGDIPGRSNCATACCTNSLGPCRALD